MQALVHFIRANAPGAANDKPRAPQSARTTRLFAAALLTLAAVPTARALDLIEVWRGAAQNDPEFSAARAAHEAGISRRAQAVALWRPTVRLEGAASIAGQRSQTDGAEFSAPGVGSTAGVSFATSITRGTGTHAAVVMRQPLVGLERDARSRQLRIAAEVAEIEWQGAQQALMLRSAERYFDAAMAGEQLRLLMRQQEATDRARVEAERRFQLGERPVTDAYEAAARAASLRSRRLAAETRLQLAHVALSDLSGMPTTSASLHLPAATPGSDGVGTLEDWLAQAQRSNPDLRLAEALLQEAEQERLKTSMAFSPTLDLVAQFGRDRLSGSGHFGDASSRSNQRVIGVQLDIPLYSGGARSARQTETQALVRKAQADLDRARQQVALQTRSAWLDLTVGYSQQSALAAAAEASQLRLDATRVGLRVGDRTTQEFLDADNDAAAAELAIVQSRVRLLMSQLQLAALGGRLDDARLAQVDTLLRNGR